MFLSLLNEGSHVVNKITVLMIQFLFQAGTSSSSANAPATTPAKPDKPIFTLKQMSMIGKTFNYFYIVLSSVAGP